MGRQEKAVRLSDAIAPTSRGKVRDLYDLGELLLFVASDRISAFDYILPDEIPGKGEVLTRLSLFWFDALSDVVPNHLVSTETTDLPRPFAPFASELAGRFMLVRKARMLPVECIVRGYLTGSGLAEYRRSGTVCGMPLPKGLLESSRLESPLYTPSTKAEIGAHDENISFEQTVEMLGAEDASTLARLSLAVYQRASDLAAQRGIIIADTKLEFGVVDGRIVLADEALTPDSSRFWPFEGYRPGASQPSFDKQFVRDWLDANWDRTGAPPQLPREVIEATSEKYVQAYELITGKAFSPL
ncbi:MAG: phosphoribosylaminoimidazolesuccinocarboxamide synthase [Coriobacteriales bacterium]|jgi:phosphoribosylaminoimidazole-succinocarboxamide synthase|nr:phosphoribosylaminoimidazolesuccinocarboxamide synthase [Coriobacteriales bacterium]